MEVKIPDALDGYTHGAVVKSLLKCNRQLKVPSRTGWVVNVPDLVHKRRRIAVEVELSDLTVGWGQCLSYYRQGALEIHLVLSPRLHAHYEKNEERFIKENPMPNIKVYSLPEVKRKTAPKVVGGEKLLKVKKKRQRQVEREVPKPIRKFYRPKLVEKPNSYILRENGSAIRTDFGESDKMVGIQNIYFPIGKRSKRGGRCSICGTALQGEVYKNAYREVTVLYTCPECGFTRGDWER